jgi:2-hydroxychromene-2-carboxylate isomerase
MTSVTWYFDFISPYSYFGLHTLQRLPPQTQVVFRPILFAGLLKQWGQKGPAEIPAKRLWTYRACVWWAREHGLPFRMPSAHPFNPLPFLRLAIAAGNTREAIGTIFTQLWTTGADPADPAVLDRLMQELQISPERLGDASVKQALRSATDEAIARGVFGVPTLWIPGEGIAGEGVAGEAFWGSDAVEFAAAYLRDPQLLKLGEFARADATPIGVMR